MYFSNEVIRRLARSISKPAETTLLNERQAEILQAVRASANLTSVQHARNLGTLKTPTATTCGRSLKNWWRRT